MLKIKNVKTMRYKGYAIYFTKATVCVICKSNKRMCMPFETLSGAKRSIDAFITNTLKEQMLCLWDIEHMREVFKYDTTPHKKKYKYFIAESMTVFGTITRRYKTVEDAKNDPSFLYDTLKGFYYDEDGHLTFEEIK